MRRLLWSLVMLSTACGASAGDTDDVDATTRISLQFIGPVSGDTFTVASLDDQGFLVASVPVELAVTGSPSRILLTQNQVIVGELGPSGVGTVAIASAGSGPLVAIAYDAEQNPAASAEVDIAIADPQVDNCQGMLDLYQLDYEVGPPSPGVDDPVTVTTPINGVDWRYVENESPRATLFGGCELVLSLARAAPYLRQRDIVEVADIGIYNYRCIGGVGTPPNCPNGISQHAYANAIDIAGVTTSDGTYASVLTDFVTGSVPTCEATPEPGADTLLHELICELKDHNVWNIVLTPNYNSDHRNHFHVDLTPGADIIRRTAPTALHEHALPSANACAL